MFTISKLIHDPLREPTAGDKQYAAGFFDGEGCVTLTRCGPHSVSIQAVIGLKYPGALQWFHARWAGKVVQRRDGYWVWQITYRPGVERFLTDIQPYLMIKKAQADYILSMTGYRFDNDDIAALQRMKRTPYVYDQ